jgi:hypothetical protein
MGVVPHRLCRRRWPSGARSSVTRLVARHITGHARCAYFGEIRARGGRMHEFNFGGKQEEFCHNEGVAATASSATGGPLAPVQAQRAWSPHHWQRSVRSFCGNLSKRGVINKFSNVAKNKGNRHINTTIRCSFAAAHTPLTPVPAQSTRSPHCWQRRVCSFC